ncbi:cytochrome P450 [Mycena epipterygia]|nr:cytochrome P450 [Mycena epipterygia]
MHIFPTEFAHYKFTEWARKYGGMYSLKVGPGTVVVLTDVAAVRELMDKRSANTADRPSFYVADLVTGGLHLALARYGETWKTLRRATHSVLMPQATARHLPIQKAEATQLLHDILRSPDSFYTHMRRYSSSVILSVLFGKRAPRYESPETTAYFEVEHKWIRLLDAGSTPPVDMLPILKLVPERWAKWKRDCRNVRNLQRALFFGLLEETKERLRTGEGNGSYMEDLLTRQENFEMDEEMIGYLGGALIDGGSATSSSYLQSLVLALVAYPDAQKKAHDEIDRVVGEHRMPTLDDLEHMPYIRAIIMETHRFRPITPLLPPHATLAQEQYGGYIIPKGTTIFVNVWGIFHDPALYDDPEDFIPDRYLLTESGTKPGVHVNDLKPNWIFGVGRRICPGIYLAQDTIVLCPSYLSVPYLTTIAQNINVMNLLWAFNFNLALDENGKTVKPDIFAYEQGIGTAPRPFKCRITARTTGKADIIQREFLEAADTFSKFEVGLSPDDKEFVAKSRTHAQ